ncbi:MAG TPA: PD-(D/E)XK nuclease family protein [Ruminiclostridium sp.]|nr:PD-(D/E)XK nuclease family protein [Ruminiclostridium sp.]
MLHIIFGRSGSGKSRLALETAQSAAKSGQNAVIIVPEQFTFETEREIVRRFGANSCLNIEVLSFSRLTHRVMNEYGGLACRYIDDCGRNVLMRLALNQIGDMLEVYSKQAKSASFVKTMVGAVAEYKVCGIDADMLSDAAKKAEGGLLRRKLSDIALIMRTYCAMLESEFSDPLDDLTRLARKLSDCPFFEGKTVVLDGFKGFTPQERDVIGKILRTAGEVYVTLCAEELGSADSTGLFSPVEKTARQLVALSNRNGCPVSPPLKLKEAYRFKKESLKYLESSVFRPESAPFEKETPDIHIISAGNIYEESKFVACEITRLVREKGCRYGEIAVISRGLDLYDGIIDPLFEKYGIPYFYDLRHDIASHPLMALVQSLLSIINSGFRQEHVLRYLKTGLAGFSVEEVSALENYVLMWDIKGVDKWREEWKNSPSGFEAGKDTDFSDELLKLNALRERVYAPIAALCDEMDKCGKSKALYEFLCRTGVREEVTDACRRLKQGGEARLSLEYGQIWEKLVSMLDQISMAARTEKLSLQEFASMLSLVIENTDLGSIPPTLDAVTIGDAERIRTGGAEYVFVIGLAEGVFPRKASSVGIISDSEKRRLIEIGLELSPPTSEQAAEERFFAYKALTSSSSAVYLTYPRGDATGRALRPSYFLPAVKKLFPQCEITDDALKNPIDTIASEKTAFDLLAGGYSEKNALNTALKSIFENRREFKDKITALDRAANGRRLEFANPMTARALYGDTMRVSPSRVETFGQCRFLYFCRYGLRAMPRKRAELDAPEIGTVIHFVLERLLSGTKEKGLAGIPEDELKLMTNALLDEFAAVYLGGLDDKPQRFRYLFSSLADTVMCLVKHMAEEFAQSGFEPADFELLIASDGDVKPFGIGLPDGGRLLVGGKVDRVDIMKHNGKTYLRVVDYKTGTKNFNLSDLVYGLNLQMFIYLFTLCNNAKERYGADIVPAGVLYVPAKKPEISAERSDSEFEIKKQTERELRMNGIVLNDPDVIFGMESGGGGRFIPAELKGAEDSDGTVCYSVTGRSSAATLEQFGILKRHIEKILRSMAHTLHSGDAAAMPVSGLGYSPCKYCDYASVCGFEQGCKVKNIFTVEKKDVFNKMKGDENDGAQMD